MAARTAWTGAINFGGFPIHLAAYNATTSKAADSFKSLCPCHHEPIRQIKTCAKSGAMIEEAQLEKGVEFSKKLYVLDPDDVQNIKDRESTKELTIERFAPLASIPMWLSDKVFRFTPDAKVPGSNGPANILWNGLAATERAAVVDGWVQRTGSRPALLAIYADPDGDLIGVTLPYQTGLAETPKGGFESDAKAAAMFEAFVDSQGYTTAEFDHEAYVDMYRERRDEMIARTMKGEPLPAAAQPAPTSAGPDLMAAMQAAMGATGKPKAGKKPAAAKKKAVKA